MTTLASFVTAGALALAISGITDTLEVRFASGAGGGTSGFTTLLGPIGRAAGHPADWPPWRGSLDVERDGRFAFRHIRYADALNYIGLDTVRIVTAAPEPSLFAMLALGPGALGVMRRKSSICSLTGEPHHVI